MKQQDGRYKFSGTVQNVIYHICTYRDRIVVGEAVDQLIHKHFNMEFHYLFGGLETIESNTEQPPTVIRPGECAVIPKGVYHGVQADTVERLCFSLTIEYNGNCENPSASDYHRIYTTYHQLREVQVVQDRFLSQMMEQYRAISEQCDLFLSAQKGLLLLCTALRLMELIHPAPSEEVREKERGNDITAINRKQLIEEYISDRFADSAGITGLSRLLYLSERQTRNLIQKEFGADYKQLIIQERMKIADILLRKISQTLEQIAQQVGYQSYSGFYLAYTRYYGISPEAARKNRRDSLHESR